jgi:hypothetical protein
MSSFIRVHYPAQHGGVARIEHAVTTLRGINALHALEVIVDGLAALGKPFTRLAARVGAGLVAWREERKLREEDRKLWDLALSDARIMADLSRAMSQDALRGNNR